MRTVAFSLIIVCICLCAGVQAGVYSGGSGVEGDPYLIGSAADIIEMSGSPADWGAHYLMIADVNMVDCTFDRAVIASDTDVTGGFQGTPFAGVFNGAGYAIQNLKIDTQGAGNDYLGLFGRIEGSAAEIENLQLERIAIVGGSNSVCLAGLCGYNYRGTISNCWVTGSVSGGNDCSFAGGLCAYNEGDISRSSFVGNVSAGGASQLVGGLCGYQQYGNINDCCSGGEVSGDESGNVGGLCGLSIDSTVSDCYSTATVRGRRDLGGLCGLNISGTITRSYSCGAVYGGDGSYSVGGLCAYNDDGIREGGVIDRCYFYVLSGPDNGFGTPLEQEQMLHRNSFTGFDFAGDSGDGSQDHWAITEGHCPRLSWQSDDGPLLPEGPVTSLAGTGHGSDPFHIDSEDDFAEFLSNSRLNCGYYVLGVDVDLNGQTFDTAVVDRDFGGHFDGGGHVVRNAAIDTEVADAVYLGLFARIVGSVSRLGVENINIACGYKPGGIGGFCGENYRGTITHCYSSGRIAGASSSNGLGGLCGKNVMGLIVGSYSSVAVSGGNFSKFIGGLCGRNEGGTISNCYATGPVTGSSEVGGLCGRNYGGMISSCYWDVESSGIGNVGDDNFGATGKATAQMQTLSTFVSAGWDFDDGDGDAGDWMMLREGEDYPRLAWQEFYAGDIAGLYGVRWDDFSELARHWADTDCPADCEDADINADGTVGLGDLVAIAEGWASH